MNRTRDSVELAHGGGGRLSRDLLDTEILSRFGDGPLAGLPDGACLPSPNGAIVFTTDSFVVQPVEFPGGNIGHLAVHGTVNDIAVCGGRPRWLSLALILEEGLPLDTLRRVLDAVARAAADCDVTVATGDTKVVGRGQADGLYINTAGIGERIPGFDCAPERIRDGDRVLLSGPLGDHGLAVMAARDSIALAGGPVSDTAPVHRLVAGIAHLADEVRFMRDPTRGGAAAVLNEAVENLSVDVVLTEHRMPVSAGTAAVCEILGIDVLHAACEGRVILVCSAHAAPRVLSTWRGLPEGRGAVEIGAVTAAGRTSGARPGRVILETVAGGRRLVDVPRGELLPRIC